MESNEIQFIYVDGYYEKSTGKSVPWKRIKISEIPNLKKKAENYNVFVTAQQFCSPQRVENELIWGPLYFDLDSSEQYPLVIAKEDTKKIIDFFTKGHGVNQEYIRVFHSGSKGFHVFINPKILGVQPDPKLNLIFKSIALYLETFLELKTLDTASIYSKRRMMRLPDSIHHKSKLFKIELYHEDLNKTVEEIQALAKQPRGSLWEDDDFGNILPIEEAAAFYKHFVELHKQQEMIEKLKPQILIRNTGETAICIKDLMENHIRKHGTRNLATMVLAAYFKDQNFSEKETIEIIVPWALRTPKEHTSTHDVGKIKASTISCIKAAFSNDYHFVCSVMRSLGEMKCAYETCEIANEEDQKPEKEIVLHLAEASNAAYIKKKIKTKVMISGKDTSPFLVPKRVELKCTPNLKEEDSSCRNCLLAKQGGHYEFELNEKDSLLLECIQCTTVQQFSVLKRLGNASCKKVILNILDMGNVEEIEITPELDRQLNAVDGNEEYVTRKAYYIGHNIPLNQEVEINCFTYADPKTQHAVHLFSDYSSAETSLNGFKMDDKKHKELSIFHPKQGQNVTDKIHAIHKDLELNVHHIWRREPLFIAIDLVYYSALSFHFQGELLRKGWSELLIIGDCVVKDTLLFTEDGIKYIGNFDKGYKKNKFLKNRDLDQEDLYKTKNLPAVASLEGIAQPTHLYCKEKTKTLQITTARRYKIEGTEKHPILCIRDGKVLFKELNELKIGDYVAIQHNQNLFGKKHNPDMGRLLGYLIGDGSCGDKQGLRFTNSIREVLDDFKRLCQNLFNYTPKERKGSTSYSLYIEEFITKKIRCYGLSRALAGDKHIPQFILEADRETVKEFIKGYFETDGYYSPQIQTVSLHSKSQRIIHELRMILLNFGIISTFKEAYNKKYQQMYYGLKITDLDFYGKFLNEIGFITQRKQKDNIKKPEGRTNRNIVPTISKLVDIVWQIYKHAHPEIQKRHARLSWMSIHTLRQVRYGVRGFSYRTLKQFISGTIEFSYLEEWQYLKYLVEQNIYWDFIKTIEKSEAETYDLHIPNSHNFVSNGFISHNSGQGKSEAIKKLSDHYGFGYRISGEGARRTGLAYTWHQTANRWSVSFGIIPRNDKRIVIIDEASGIEDEEISKLTDMRSEGIADARGGPVPARTNARTRLIWMTNTKTGLPLSEYPYPVTAIQQIFKRTEDIRRFDLAISVRSGDVPDEMVNQLVSQRDKIEHTYTAYLCRNLLLWIWTRKADQIVVSEEAEKNILETSMLMSKKYSSLIPLVEPSDQRNKIARLSVSVAARLFSTDETGEKVIVKKEHVDFVSAFLQEQYDCNALDYLNYSKLNKREFLDTEYDEIYSEFCAFPEPGVVADALIKMPFFRKAILEELIGFGKDDMKKLIKFLHSHNLLKATNHGFRLTAAGINFCKMYLKQNPFKVTYNQITAPEQVQDELVLPKHRMDVDGDGDGDGILDDLLPI